MYLRKFTIMISAILLIESFISAFPIVYTYSSSLLPCTCDDEFNSFYTDDDDTNTKYIDIFWTESNLKLLNDDERKILDDIQNKMITNNRLDKEDIDQMAELKDIVIKSKLAENEYNDFKEIINKKRNREQLTTEEVVRLKSYFNSIQ